MRVFAKKAFEFSRRELKDGMMVVAENATTIPLAFVDLPDWVETDPMFEWARADEDIEIIQSKADEKSAELGATTKGNKVKSETITEIK
ncbi:MAG TPA: hypothetical protein VN456_04695 [Desulfosporosinus sp.]|nr:hypothetical protein [Desulfosporosinus sp.]